MGEPPTLAAKTDRNISESSESEYGLRHHQHQDGHAVVGVVLETEKGHRKVKACGTRNWLRRPTGALGARRRTSEW